MKTGSGIRGSVSVSAVGPGVCQRLRRVGLECLLDRLPRTRNPDQMSLGTDWRSFRLKGPGFSRGMSRGVG